ncbi:MAG: oligopeptide transporter, OPT family [Ignavibacteria bacterium]|nr:oligopeptide transporter, OPT family [Ignavibacteria bacterium]
MEHKPYIPPDTDLKDFTLKAVVIGAIFGVIFGSANAYLGLRVGLTISTSIPLAVISVAVFRLLQPVIGKSSVLDYNISQTTGSAASSLASGIIFTIPALFLWGYEPAIAQIGALALLGGVLGVLFMIPLRRFLIVREHENLPYPEGTASAEVLIAADAGGTRARNVFAGLGVGAAYKALVNFFNLWPDWIAWRIPVLRKAELSIEPMPALLGVGYILGYRVSAIMVGGGLLSWIGIIPVIAYFGDGLSSPLFPEQSKLLGDMEAGEIWSRYIRYIGAGAVAAAGIMTAISALPTMFESLRIGVSELRSSSGSVVPVKLRTERDLPMKFVLLGVVAVIAVIAFVPHIVGDQTTLIFRLVAAVCIAIFAFLFVTVASRIVGLVGVTSNPTSGMTIVTLLGTSLVFYALGWTDMFGKITVLTIGTVVCVASSISGDMSQDLKTGFLVGATPAKQQISELIGAMVPAFFIAGSVWLLGQTYTFGSPDLPAPQATLMKTVIEGVLAADLPWSLVAIGAAFAIIVEMLGVPSLPFAVGMYLPLSATTPIYVGGVVSALVARQAKGNKEKLASKKEQGVLLSSGLIAGEGIMGVIIAFYAFAAGAKPAGIGIDLGGGVSLAGFLLLIAYLIRKTRSTPGEGNG